MDQAQIYILLLCIIVIVGQLFNRTTIPISLLLVIVGMGLSFIPAMPEVTLNPSLVLNIFLPILIYQISSFSSWRDMRKNLLPVLLLSVGHVLFITFLVAIVIHYLIPALGWPIAILMGAIISPPDDVAIVSIAEKIRMPSRIVTILEGEGMLNDATALIVFRFSLAVIATHSFSITTAVSSFFIIVIGETLYGLLVGVIMGELRKKINNTAIHTIASMVTPFIAYSPVAHLGGSGVIATVMAGFVIGNRYAVQFTPEYRLVSRNLWPMFSYIIQNILYLTVGLNLRAVMHNISQFSFHILMYYAVMVVLTVIIGRFIWVFPAAYLPRFLFAAIRKKDPYPPWQYPIITAWAGMRGSISLAAALAVPVLPVFIEGISTQDFLVFLVFSVIIATLVVQGLTLPVLLRLLGMHKHGQKEMYKDHIMELNARIKLVRVALRWLKAFKQENKENEKILDQVNLLIQSYKMLKNHLKETVAEHDGNYVHDDHAEIEAETFLTAEIIKLERNELLRLWHEDKINIRVRNKLMDRLDHRTKNLPA